MPLKTQLDEVPAINLTPMIDVVFNLIIFFVVGTRFADMERSIAVQVPAVRDAQTLSPAPEKRVINVDRDGRVSLDKQIVTLDELTATLAAARGEYADLGVVIRGDEQAPFQHVAGALNACRRAGISEMGISVRMAQAATGERR
jgi:biopolymer transport protein ExbD